MDVDTESPTPSALMTIASEASSLCLRSHNLKWTTAPSTTVLLTGLISEAVKSGLTSAFGIAVSNPTAMSADAPKR